VNLRLQALLYYCVWLRATLAQNIIDFYEYENGPFQESHQPEKSTSDWDESLEQLLDFYES